MIVLDNATFLSGEGQGWGYSELVGWDDLTDDKARIVERPQSHGAFLSDRSLRSAKAISFTANLSSGSLLELNAEKARVAALGAEGPVWMSVTLDGETSFRRVTVAGVTVSQPYTGVWFVTARVHVIAADPRRYAAGEWLSTEPPSAGQGEVWPEIYPVVWPGGGSTGRVELVNSGRAPSSPMFRLNGGFSSATNTCVETGGRVMLDRPVPSGQFVELDFGSRRALLDGVSDVSRWLRFREWSDVPGGFSRSFQFDVTDPVGSPTMQGRVDSAWW